MSGGCPVPSLLSLSAEENGGTCQNCLLLEVGVDIFRVPGFFLFRSRRILKPSLAPACHTPPSLPFSVRFPACSLAASLNSSPASLGKAKG